MRERGELYRAFSLAGNQVLHPYEPTTSPDRIEYDKAARKEAMEAQKAKKTGKKPDDSVYDCSWCPELDIFMYPFFDNLFNGFKEEFAGVVKGLEEKNCQIINTQADQLIQTVLSFVQAAIDPFLPKAGTEGLQ